MTKPCRSTYFGLLLLLVCLGCGAGPQSSTPLPEVEVALQLIEESSYELYVSRHITTITLCESSYIIVQTQKLCLDRETIAAGTFWLASAITHDSCHVAQNKQGRRYHGPNAEIECLLIQIDFLQEVKAPRYLIDYCYEEIEEWKKDAEYVTLLRMLDSYPELEKPKEE